MLKARLKLLLILVIFASPWVAAHFLYSHGYRPSGTKSHGQILTEPANIRAILPAEHHDFALLWLGSTAEEQSCFRDKTTCSQDNVGYWLQQIHIALHKDQNRLSEILLSEAQEPQLTHTQDKQRHQYQIALSNFTAYSQELLGNDKNAVAWLVDPEGFVIISYRFEQLNRRMLSDLHRLLSYHPAHTQS